jgi:hypothetical protein
VNRVLASAKSARPRAFVDSSRRNPPGTTCRSVAFAPHVLSLDVSHHAATVLGGRHRRHADRTHDHGAFGASRVAEARASA